MSNVRRKDSLLLALLGTVLLVSGACEDNEGNDLPLAPTDCEELESRFGYIDGVVTISIENPNIPVNVYEGDFEDNILVDFDTLDVNQFSWELLTEVEYTFTAQYVVGPDTILVLDSDKIITSKEEFQDADCWSTADGDVDLRLQSPRPGRAFLLREQLQLVDRRTALRSLPSLPARQGAKRNSSNPVRP